VLKRSTTFLAALLALALPVAVLQASSSAQAAAQVVLFDQTGTASPPSADSSAPNFSPSNYFGSGNDRTADDFTVPAGATWAINEIDVTGAFEGPTTANTVNVYLYANGAGKPGTEIFSQLGVTATAGPNFAVPLTGVPSLTAGTYWVTVQFVVDGGAYWSWGTSTVQRGNPATWLTESGSPECPSGAWGTRTTCWTGTNPDQAFVLKGTDLTPSNAITLGKLARDKKAGTASLPVTVPGAGTLALAGKRVVARQLAATGAGTLPLKVKAKGAAKRKLNRTGKVTVTVSVTFTPTGGVAKTVTKKVKLRKKLD
jgi:hypothetical protein